MATTTAARELRELTYDHRPPPLRQPKAAPSNLPFQPPPACASINVRCVPPRGSSTQTCLLTCPDTQYSFGP